MMIGEMENNAKAPGNQAVDLRRVPVARYADSVQGSERKRDAGVVHDRLGSDSDAGLAPSISGLYLRETASG